MPKRKRSSSTKKKKPSTRPKKRTRYNNTMTKFKPELKAVDLAVGRQLSSGETFYYLNGIQQGTGRYERIGKQVWLKTLEYSLYITPQSAPILTQKWNTDIPRIMIVLDRKPTGSLPIISDILKVQGYDGATSTNPQSFTNLDNQKRFKILMNWEPILPSFQHNTDGTITNVGPNLDPTTPTFSKHGYIRLKKLCSYLNSTGSLAAIEGPALYVVWDSFYSGTSQMSSPWYLRIETRLRYYDP